MGRGGGTCLVDGAAVDEGDGETGKAVDIRLRAEFFDGGPGELGAGLFA